MWNGNAVAVRVLFLAVSFGSIVGCDTGAGPPRTVQAASNPPPESRYQIDPARKRAWSLRRDGVVIHDLGTAEKVAVPLPDWLWVGEDYSCLPDLAIGPKGEAVITSNILPTLWRIDPETFAVSVHPLILDADTDKDVGFTGLVYSPTHHAYFAVSDPHGSLWRIDPVLAKAEKIPLSAPIPRACGLQLRTAQRKTLRPIGLCARGRQVDWVIDFSFDRRSAFVRTASCEGGRTQSDALSAEGA